MKRKLNNKGQAAIETALALPLLIWLTYYTINAFHSLHTAHVGQQYSTMNLNQRLQNQSKFVVDRVNNTLYGREFMAVQYVDQRGNAPVRRIVTSEGSPTRILSTIGICLEPRCR